MKKLLIIATILCLFPITVIAEKTPGPTASTSGDLSLTIVASDSPDFIKEWVSTKPEHSPTIKRIHHTKPDQLVVVAFIVSGVSGDKENNYQFSINFYVLDPNDKPIFGERDYAKGRGKLPKKPMLIMADPALDIVLEQSDPEGVYTIVAQVIDLVSGNKTDNFYKIKFEK